MEGRGQDGAQAGAEGLRDIQGRTAGGKTLIPDHRAAVGGHQDADLVALGAGGDAHGVRRDLTIFVGHAPHIAAHHHGILHRTGGGPAGIQVEEVVIHVGQRAGDLQIGYARGDVEGDHVLLRVGGASRLEEEIVAHEAVADVIRPVADLCALERRCRHVVDPAGDGLIRVCKNILGEGAVHGALQGKDAGLLKLGNVGGLHPNHNLVVLLGKVGGEHKGLIAKALVSAAEVDGLAVDEVFAAVFRFVIRLIVGILIVHAHRLIIGLKAGAHPEIGQGQGIAQMNVGNVIAGFGLDPIIRAADRVADGDRVGILQGDLGVDVFKSGLQRQIAVGGVLIAVVAVIELAVGFALIFSQQACVLNEITAAIPVAHE